MSPEEAIEFARRCFLDRGVVVGRMLPSNDPPGYHYFSSGGSCHSLVFEGGNYIHFHVGKGAWAKSELSKDAPNERIRQMVVNGKDIPESECYPC
jgi:hypothetical protein